MATDCELILAYLQDHGSITDDEAKETYGIKRLSARIHDLRKKGHCIQTDVIPCDTRRGKVSSYAKYRLLEVAG